MHANNLTQKSNQNFSYMNKNLYNDKDHYIHCDHTHEERTGEKGEGDGND